MLPGNNNADGGASYESRAPRLISKWFGRGVLRAIAVLALGITAGAIYGRAMVAPFIFDDRVCIAENPSITRLWPLVGGNKDPGPLNPSKEGPTAGRPLVNLTLALNYHFGALNPVGYHVANLIMHLVATLLVGLIVQRIFCLDFFAGRFSAASGPLAFLTALLWSVHPLQTETVVYVTQRTELMVGVCYLATVYGSLRYWAAASPSGRRLWLTLSTATCVAGMACKEVMVTAPVVVLLLERTLIRGTFGGAIRKSWPLYIGLSLSWVLLLGLNYGSPRATSAGFHLNVYADAWWLTQAKVLWMYFKLVVWPWPLLIHYNVPYLKTIAEAWPWLLASAVLGGATIVLVWRRQVAGLAGAWVLLILSPTLVVPIITEVAAERRMYLPLAATVALVIAGGYWLVQQAIGTIGTTDGRSVKRRAPAAIVAAAGTILALIWSLIDMERLEAYQDPIALWRDTINRQPGDSIDYNNLGCEFLNRDQLNEALEPLQRALKLNHTDPKIYNNLGVALDGLGRAQEAIEQFREALKIDPRYANAKTNLGFALTEVGRTEEAITELEAAVKMRPDDATAHSDLGIALGKAGRLQEAIEEFRRAMAIRPSYPAAYINLGVALLKVHEIDDAIRAFELALQYNSKNSEAQTNLAVALVAAGKPQEAIGHFEEALRLNPKQALQIHVALGDAYLSINDPSEAIAHYQKAAESAAVPASLHEKLGVVLAKQDRLPEAIAQFETVLQMAPTNIENYTNLATAYKQMQRTADAIAVTEKALAAARSQDNAAVSQQLEARLKNYRTDQAHHSDGE
jgi:protein O-mannosyl-transferase